MGTEADLPLLVLDASAGSGKTYNLVRRYLRLLLSCSQPVELKEIVAMTFTNKAATEMKTRIVRDLHRLAWKDKEFAKDVSEMARECNCTPEELVKNARTTLTKLLHAYEDFNVLTIDKFNLRLIRSFSRDLNLPEQFEISLEENLLLEKSVDELLGGITAEDSNRMTNLALQFALENHESERSWDLRSAIISDAQVLQSEKFFPIIEELRNSDLSPERYQLLKLQLSSITQEHDRLRRDLALVYERTKDFFDQKGRSHAKQKLLQFIECPITDKKFEDGKYRNSYLDSLMKYGSECPGFDVNAVEAVAQSLDKNTASVLSLKIQLEKFYVMAFLKELAQVMENIRQKEGIIRISEFNKLISELVKNEEAPFIYERLGNRFKHYFLDEFQDTSRLQWSNLVPLLHESLAHNRFNLIVGDPKQSIYRFKNGVAQQFVELPKIYNPEGNPFVEQTSAYFDDRGKKLPLKDNWRSASEIVKFNNQLFSQLRSEMAENVGDFYSSIEQNPKGKEGGLITFHLSGETKKSDTFFTEELWRIESWVEECIADGYHPFDICILCLKKKHGNLVANHLRKRGYEVVSSDSLLLGADSRVNMVASFLEWKHYHGDPQYVRRFMDLWLRENYPDAMTEFLDLLRENSFGKKEPDVEALNKKIPGILALVNASFQDLYSLLKDIYRVLGLDETQNAWLFQLLDVAADFDKTNGPDLKSFLDYFNVKKYSINVQTPDRENAIRLMTVHKSKGLEFPVVIYPNFSFKDSADKKVLTKLDDFVVHLNLKSFPLLKHLNEENEAEENARILDKLNELYVALTRPTDRLYFSAPSSTLINKKLAGVIKELYPEFVSGNAISGRIGTPSSIHHAEIAGENQFYPANLANTLWFPEISLISPEDNENTSLNRQKRIGNMVHSILESVHSYKEAIRLTQQNIHSGIIEKELQSEIESLLHTVFSNKEYNALLERGIIHSERTLILDPEVKMRPDKLILSEKEAIVIDYKTGEKLPEHRQQVSNYLFALSEIGYATVEGYLYYLQENRLERVQRDLFS